MSGENGNLGAIAGHLYDIKNMLGENNSILKEKLSKIEYEIRLARQDFDIIVGLSTPKIELLNRKKDLLKEEIDSYSGCFPDECVEYREKLDKALCDLEQSIEQEKNQLYEKIMGGKE